MMIPIMAIVAHSARQAASAASIAATRTSRVFRDREPLSMEAPIDVRITNNVMWHDEDSVYRIYVR